MNDNESVILFVDGSCDNKFVGQGTNFGAWCVIIRYGDKERIIEGREENTTNMRMELAGLTRCIPNILEKGIKNIRIITDSMYVVYGINGKNKWQKRKSLPNDDLWNPIYDAIDKHNAFVKAKWVKGHNGHLENERCDKIANEAVKENTVIGFKD
jgi:ribonuclease HI